MIPPIHKHQLPILALCFSQAIGIATNTHIYPFIASLMLSKGVKPDQVSTYAAIAESAMSFAFLFCLRLHVWAVGRFSHRRLQIFSLVACGINSASLGWCQHPWQMIAVRCLTGIVAIGSVLNVVVLGDLVDDATKERSYSWFTAGSYFGFMSGAAFSGCLAEPFGRIPLLGRLKIFVEYPYTLPGCAMLSCSILASICVACLVPETNRKLLLAHETTEETEDEPSVTFKDLLASPSFRRIAVYHFFSRLCYFGSLGLLTTAGTLPNALGGLGMRIPEIATLLFVTQLLVALVLVFLSGRITKAISLRGIALISSIGFVSIAAYFPVASHLKSVGFTASWLPKLLWLYGQSTAELWIPKQGVTILGLYPVPRNRALAVGAIKQIAWCGGAIGTATYGTMFGVSSGLPRGTLGREAVWILTCGLALLCTVVAYAQPTVIDKNRQTVQSVADEPHEQSRLLQPVVENE